MDPKVLEEAQQAAELVEREDLLSVLPDEIRMKAEVLYAEAMDQYTRIWNPKQQQAGSSRISEIRSGKLST